MVVRKVGCHMVLMGIGDSPWSTSTLIRYRCHRTVNFLHLPVQCMHSRLFTPPYCLSLLGYLHTHRSQNLKLTNSVSGSLPYDASALRFVGTNNFRWREGIYDDVKR